MSTIAAISTAPGIGGIGIIRMSGENCFEVLEKIFKQKKYQKIEDIKGYSIKYGNIVDNDDIVDEVLVSYFKAPNSYTSENMCEINSHGGIVIITHSNTLINNFDLYHVHLLDNKKIIKTGGKELAQDILTKGFKELDNSSTFVIRKNNNYE